MNLLKKLYKNVNQNEVKKYRWKLNNKEISEEISDDLKGYNPTQIKIWRKIWDKHDYNSKNKIPLNKLREITATSLGINQEKADIIIFMGVLSKVLTFSNRNSSDNSNTNKNEIYIRPALPSHRPALYIDDVETITDKKIWINALHIVGLDYPTAEDVFRKTIKHTENIHDELKITSIIYIGLAYGKIVRTYDIEKGYIYKPSQKPYNGAWASVWKYTDAGLFEAASKDQIKLGLIYDLNIPPCEANRLLELMINAEEVYSPSEQPNNEFLINHQKIRKSLISSSKNNTDSPTNINNRGSSEDIDNSKYETYRQPDENIKDIDIDKYALKQFVKKFAEVDPDAGADLKVHKSTLMDAINRWGEINNIDFNKLSTDTYIDDRKKHLKNILEEEFNTGTGRYTINGKRKPSFNCIELSDLGKELVDK